MHTTEIFKSKEKRDAIRAMYDGFLSAMPFGKRSIDTSFGKTFVLEAGDPSAEPMVLLHGSCTNSAFWFNELLAMSKRFHVFALDLIGEAGNSAEYRPDLASNEYALWLREAIRALGATRVNLVGNSLGSWLALKYAVLWPEDVIRLLLFAPAGIAKQRYEAAQEAEDASASGETLTMPEDTGMPPEIVRFINLILSGFNPIFEELPRYTDEEIRRLDMPVLFVAGREDELLDAPAAAERLAKLAPQAEIHLLPQTGHTIQNAYQFLTAYFAENQ